MTYLLIIVQMLVVLLAAPLTIGMVRSMKARFQNRRGASIVQPYWALFALMRKEMTITRNSSWVFRFVPFVVLGVALLLAALVPTIAYGILPSGADNIFFIAALMALGSVFLVFGGMDTGSAFGNMGSSREMTIASLVEPALLLTLATLGLIAGAWSLDSIVGYFATTPWGSVVPISSITLIGLVFVTLAENARYPVDNPATHLELTMVHEAMLLEYSGPYLAMLEYASAIKLTVMLLLIANLVLPFFLLSTSLSLAALPVAFLALLVKLALGAFLVALIESIIVKMRFYRMQEYLTYAALFAAAGFVLVLLSTHPFV